MQRTYVKYLCDFCETELERPAPLKISIGGRDYEVDLCQTDRDPIEMLEEQLRRTASVNGRATRVRAKRRAPGVRAESTNGHTPIEMNGNAANVSAVAAMTYVPDDKTADYSTVIRDWAKANGLAVAERGRIASAIVKAYQAAYKAQAKTTAA